MKQIIYIDVLIFLNTVVTFLLLLATSKLLKEFPSVGRLVCGALMGGASSLIIFAPELGFVLSLVIKFLFSVVITSVTYNPKSVRIMFKSVGYFFCASFIFAGIILFIVTLPGLSILTYRNGAVYIDFSLFSLISAAVICYVITITLNKITKHSKEWEILINVQINAENNSVRSSAIVDTGNALTDPFSGESVVIADRYALAPVLPENVKCYLDGGNEIGSHIRLVPCSTVTDDGLLPVFRVDSMILYDGGTKKIEKPLIAVSEKKLPHVILPRDVAEIAERRTECENVFD